MEKVKSKRLARASIGYTGKDGRESQDNMVSFP